MMASPVLGPSGAAYTGSQENTGQVHLSKGDANGSPPPKRRKMEGSADPTSASLLKPERMLSATSITIAAACSIANLLCSADTLPAQPPPEACYLQQAPTENDAKRPGDSNTLTGAADSCRSTASGGRTPPLPAREVPPPTGDRQQASINRGLPRDPPLQRSSSDTALSWRKWAGRLPAYCDPWPTADVSQAMPIS